MRIRLRMIPTEKMEKGVVYFAVGAKETETEDPPPLSPAVLEVWDENYGWTPVEVEAP